MGDFVYWQASEPPPAAVKTKFVWPAGPCLGLRRTVIGQVHRAHRGHHTIVLVAQWAGHRDATQPTTLSKLGSRLLDNLGDSFVHALDGLLGPVAGVLVDHHRNSALVWRDRFGRIPLQMVRLPTGWCVTSSPETVEAISAGRPRWSVVENYLCQAQLGDSEDFFDDVERIRPGEAVMVTARGVQHRQRWWNPRPSLIDPDRAEAAMVDVVHQITEPWRTRPHVLALSGGIDSAVLATVATRHARGAGAITLTDPLSSRCEFSAASETAQALGLNWKAFDIRHHWPLSRPADHRLPAAWGPPAFPDAAWRLPLHRWLRPRVGDLPLICGNGADEALWLSPTDWLRTQWEHLEIRELVRAAHHLPLRTWLGTGLRTALGDEPVNSWREVVPHLSSAPVVWHCPQRWIVADHQPHRACPAEDRSTRRLDRLWSMRWELAMRSLAQEERLSGRKIFAPFLDARFWELSLALKTESLVVGGRQKAALRRVGARELPRTWVERPKFGGFDDLVERGLARHEVPKVLALMARARLARWDRFDGPQFMAAYEAYRRPPHLGQHRASYRGSWAIWSTLATELWLRRCGGL